MEKSDLRAAYHRLTLSTSDTYPQEERLLCLKECFDELAKRENFLSQNEVTEITEFVQSVLTRHVKDILNG